MPFLFICCLFYAFITSSDYYLELLTNSITVSADTFQAMVSDVELNQNLYYQQHIDETNFLNRHYQTGQVMTVCFVGMRIYHTFFRRMVVQLGKSVYLCGDINRRGYDHHV